MIVITIRQPWAWAIAKGYKTVENRGWTTSHRGPLAIHSAKKWDDPAVEAFQTVRGLARKQGAALPERPTDDLPLIGVGLIIAVVDLVSICTASLKQPGPVRCDCGPWAQPGEAHWLLANARPLSHPIAAKGRLSLWAADVPDPATTLEAS